MVGLPVNKGQYRSLAIQTTSNGQTRTHQAIEFCWASLDHCVVYDPQIEFLDSVVNNFRIARAEGYGERIEEEAAPLPAPGEVGIMAVCRLASNRNIVGRSSTWAARTVNYKNIYGHTLVSKNLAGQKIGITCNSSCYPTMSGYSYLSSARGYLGWHATCANKHANGKTGRQGTSVSETKCTHKFSGSASASVTVKGVGSGINLAWSVNGGVDASGGALTDTCGYF